MVFGHSESLLPFEATDQRLLTSCPTVTERGSFRRLCRWPWLAQALRQFAWRRHRLEGHPGRGRPRNRGPRRGANREVEREQKDWGRIMRIIIKKNQKKSIAGFRQGQFAKPPGQGRGRLRPRFLATCGKRKRGRSRPRPFREVALGFGLSVRLISKRSQPELRRVSSSEKLTTNGWLNILKP